MVTEFGSAGIKEKLVVESKNSLPNIFEQIYLQNVSLSKQTQEPETAEREEDDAHHYIHILKTMQNQYFQVENVTRITALAGKSQRLTVSTSEIPNDETIETFGAERLSEKQFSCPSVPVFYRNALHYHNLITGV